jgi:hypothetical protein
MCYLNYLDPELLVDSDFLYASTSEAVAGSGTFLKILVVNDTM